MVQKKDKHCASCAYNQPTVNRKRFCAMHCEPIFDELRKCDQWEYPKTASDPVEKPAHYTQGNIEVIEFIMDQKMDYLEGNVVKYLCRYKYKGKPLEDLQKARTYINWLIDREAEKQ